MSEIITGGEFGYKLLAIKTDQFATIDDASPNPLEVKVGSSFGLKVSEDASEVAISFKATFTFKDIPFIVLSIVCLFRIEREKLNITNEGTKMLVTLPDEFIKRIAFITQCTAGGILHEKLKDSDYKNFILPASDLSNLKFR